MNALLHLYPRAWRDRYGEEMSALLEERPVAPFDWLDLILGAFDAHLHRRDFGRGSLEGKGIPMSLRIGAGAAIVGGILWMLTLVVAVLGGETNTNVAFALLVVASVTLLIALAGLSAFQSRRHPLLVWSSVLLVAVGVVLLTGGMLAQFAFGDRPVVGDLAPWAFLIVGMLLALIGCAAFGIVTLATGGLPRWSAGLLCVGAVLQLLGMAGTNPFQGVLLAAGGAVFGLAWILFGREAFRADGIRLIDQPA